MYCITMKSKAKDLQACYLNRNGSSHIFEDNNKKKGNKTNLCMKGCKDSVVDTSGHKHRECIVWTKSIITTRAKIVDQQAIIDAASANAFIWLSDLLLLWQNRVKMYFSSCLPYKENNFKPPWPLKLNMYLKTFGGRG